MSKTIHFCWYCGIPLAHKRTITYDHQFPKWRGGDNSHLNCVICCYECNHRKAHLDLEQYRQKVIWEVNLKLWKRQDYVGVRVKYFRFYAERKGNLLSMSKEDYEQKQLSTTDVTNKDNTEKHNGDLSTVTSALLV
jgi:hypothetical protein